MSFAGVSILGFEQENVSSQGLNWRKTFSFTASPIIDTGLSIGTVIGKRPIQDSNQCQESARMQEKTNCEKRKGLSSEHNFYIC